MLDTFRNWINMILALGILFTVIRIIVPNTKLKKYIYSLMGIVTIIVILNPVINLIKKLIIHIDKYLEAFPKKELEINSRAKSAKLRIFERREKAN